MILCISVSVVPSVKEKSKEESRSGHVVLFDFSLLVWIFFLKKKRSFNHRLQIVEIRHPWKVEMIVEGRISWFLPTAQDSLILATARCLVQLRQFFLKSHSNLRSLETVWLFQPAGEPYFFCQVSFLNLFANSSGFCFGDFWGFFECYFIMCTIKHFMQEWEVIISSSVGSHWNSHKTLDPDSPLFCSL